MKTKDCIKQIISNEPSGWDQADTMSFQFYDAEVGGVVYGLVTIDFEGGFVECYKDDEVAKTYAIKVTLEDIEE